MREILFRAKSVYTGEWVYGNYMYNRRQNTHVILYYECPCQDGTKPSPEEYNLCDCDVVPETVCQYTGYKDDTGKRIFEGDIVTFEDITSTESGYSEMDCCGKVGYDEDEACFYVTDRLSAESWEVLGGCHIIGNIFDNPELLNGEMT